VKIFCLRLPFEFSFQNPGIATAVARITWWGIPFIGGGIVYTSTVNMLANIRGKTDPINHFWGGAAVGALLGKHCKSYNFNTVLSKLERRK